MEHDEGKIDEMVLASHAGHAKRWLREKLQSLGQSCRYELVTRNGGRISGHLTLSPHREEV
jgi:hypothetical protein